MRTKTLLLTAALSVASVATSMADVFSVNAVGYINLTLPPGYSLIANQLNASNNVNTLNKVLPSVPVESLVNTFSANVYHSDIFNGSTWEDALTGDPSTTVISPGKGFFFYNPTAGNITNTFVGEVPQGTNVVSLVPGYTLMGSPVPQQLSLKSNSFPQVLEMQFLTFKTNTYTAQINDGTPNGSGWQDPISGNPTDPLLAVGQGAFIYNPGATPTNWTRAFSVNN